MNVGEAAERSGLPAKTIRYYEDIGLVRPARAANGYRDYSASDIHRLAFLRRARGLGFSIPDCRQLMALYEDRSRASHDVREIAAAHVEAIGEKLRELEQMRATLQKLINACHGDERPDCPILEDIAGGEGFRAAPSFKKSAGALDGSGLSPRQPGVILSPRRGSKREHPVA